jgi:uncharacterized repeat protein (TIGR02543 family)
MKKILVAIATAAMTFAGLTAPANAVAPNPTISGHTNGSATVGTTLTGTRVANLPVGYTSAVWGFHFCSGVETTVSEVTTIGTLNTFNGASPRCDWIEGAHQPTTTWIVASSFDDEFSSTTQANTIGWYVRFLEIATDGSNYLSYWSEPVQIASAAQTVTYSANSGVGSIAASVANGARNLSDGSGFTLSGYTFAGWNTAANGSGTAIASGASYTPSSNVTLYAQWTRIPTPPAPVFTSPIAAAPVGGILNLTGANLANVTSITVGNVAATVATSSTGQVTVKLPDLAPGKYDLTIKNADGGIRFIDGLVVPDPNAKVAPKPTNTYIASSAVKVTGSAPSAKQSAALKEFVAQYKNAKQATVYIRTSKAGLAAAKKAAAAMLATVTKTLKKVKTGIVVDSTSEKTTSLDLVVND